MRVVRCARPSSIGEYAPSSSGAPAGAEFVLTIPEDAGLICAAASSVGGVENGVSPAAAGSCAARRPRDRRPARPTTAGHAAGARWRRARGASRGRTGSSVSAIAGVGRVASRSDPASTGAITEKFGTQPAIVRLSPARAAATFTGLSSRSPTRTTTCGHASRPARSSGRRPGGPCGAKQRQRSAPIGSAPMPAGRRKPAGAMAASSWPSATSSSIVSRGAVHSIDTPGASARSRAQQLGEERQHEVRRGEAETRCEPAGSKRPQRREHALDAAQDRLRLLEKGERERRRLHAPIALEQQRIAELGRRRASEWLTADCVRPSRSAARVTLRSAISTSNTTSS